MAFTDKDLKRLKEHLCECQAEELSNNLPDSAIYALIARLEAAENFGEMMVLTYVDADETVLYQAWRKAAGK